jgi:hypothetical protein
VKSLNKIGRGEKSQENNVVVKKNAKRLITDNSKLVFSYISDQNSQLLNIIGGSGVYTLGLSTYTFKIGMILMFGLVCNKWL